MRLLPPRSRKRERFPRSLTQREREILDFLLTPEIEGIEALRRQAETARVTGKCECGCATINLAEDRATTPASEVAAAAPVEAVRYPADPANTHGLMLWVEDGWLAGVEIWWISEPPAQFPPPDEFEITQPKGGVGSHLGSSGT